MDYQEQIRHPPVPPPLPPSQRATSTSKVALKVTSPPPGWALEGPSTIATRGPSPAGLYFFYGTLQDRGILSEVLNLDRPPILKPAYISGYELRLWGQYPAIVDGQTCQVVEGKIFEVSDATAAGRLAEYETKNYWPARCTVRFHGAAGEEMVEGWTFKFCGRLSELSEGSFDLGLWLRRMRR
ncbi:hypothetical protein LTR37_011954 [Vermiconidia calcicola]|uniref:Uncharacterized protein n=1 Tax=Vermiconidia calcicola TaxID=1690605 RepID=A0ACC3N250_9PEZI|nr:hypothetical protein LTR37_011954 [Vermiconidia calcicola]